MTLLVLAAIVTLAVVGALVRLWWVLRERRRQRRVRSWERWWAAYRLRLPTILMARWVKGRLLAHRPDTTA